MWLEFFCRVTLHLARAVIALTRYHLRKKRVIPISRWQFDFVQSVLRCKKINVQSSYYPQIRVDIDMCFWLRVKWQVVLLDLQIHPMGYLKLDLVCMFCQISFSFLNCYYFDSFWTSSQSYLPPYTINLHVEITEIPKWCDAILPC